MDRSVSTTRARIVSLLTRVPQGVTRANLHCITGSTALIHQALQELVDDGIVTERLITTVRGKPRREYCLTENLNRFNLAPVEQKAPQDDKALPGAKAIVESIVTSYPGTSRSDMWSKAVVTKSWVSQALDELIGEGKVVETMEEDSRGGLIRKYWPTSADRHESEADAMRTAS
jgi:hypothetical protein